MTIFNGNDKIQRELDELKKTVRELKDELVRYRVLSGFIIAEHYNGNYTTITHRHSERIDLEKLMDFLKIEQVTEQKEENIVIRKKKLTGGKNG